ncbi:MAG: hypothetical protein O3B37_07290 [Proteobacteria bacterium]|nr:hypothetical protein [Pseudomonadota bacterium]
MTANQCPRDTFRGTGTVRAVRAVSSLKRGPMTRGSMRVSWKLIRSAPSGGFIGLQRIELPEEMFIQRIGNTVLKHLCPDGNREKRQHL